MQESPVRSTLVRRLIITVAAMVWAASLTGYVTSDFAMIWVGARGLLEGKNPYDLVGPGQEFSWAYPLVYPLTSILVGVPFAAVPLWLANALFTAGGAGLLAWGLTRERLHDPRLLVFFSLPFVHASVSSQWSPLLTGAALVPGFGWLLACKPTIGLPLLLWRPNLWRFVLAGAWTLLSLAIWPQWPMAWIPTLSAVPHITPPVLQPWGWLLLAPLAFWTYPPARLLVLLACLPQSPIFYEAVILFLVVRTWSDAACLWLTTLLVPLLVPINVADPQNVYEVLPASAPRMLWGAYFPALAIVLRHGWRQVGLRFVRDALRVSRRALVLYALVVAVLMAAAAFAIQYIQPEVESTYTFSAGRLWQVVERPTPD